MSAALQSGGAATKLGTLQLLTDLGLDDEQQQLEDEMMADVAELLEHADGPAGDRVKYEAAVAQMLRRWKIFIALHGCDEQEPTDEMIKSFVGFMYRYRQRPSRTGREGLGDAVAKMARYTLAQVRG